MNIDELLSEFKHIASAPKGVQKIREMILILGVSGRLVANMTNSSVPSISPKAISNLEDKARERRINRKQHHGSYSFQFPLSIPKNWTIAKLNEIALINMGQSPDGTSVSQIEGNGLPFYQGKAEFGMLYPTPIKWCNNPKKIAVKDDILLSIRAPVGSTNLCREESCIGRGIAAISVIEDVKNTYILYVLRALEKHIADLGTGSTFTAISQKDIQGVPIPIPSLEEQKRIVAKIDKLMAICDQLDSQQQDREALCKITQKALLVDLATAKSSEALAVAWNRLHNNFNLWLNNEDAVTELKDAVSFLGCCGFLTESSPFYITESNIKKSPLPTGWSWKTLDQLSEYITSGSRGWKKYMASQGDIFIRSQDIKYDALIFEDRASVNLPEQVEGMRTLVRPGDLLMTITGANVGKCAQVPQLNQKAYVSQHVALIKIEDSRNTPFLHWWITNNFGGRKHLAKYIYGDKPGLNLTQVRNIPIPLPPPKVQDRIVEALEHYKALFDRLANQVKEARNTAELLASAAVASITGIQIEDKEKMKVPKTELVSTLRIGVSPTNSERAPLVAILIRNDGEMPAKTLWQASGLEIDAFYQQLKTEMARGWIVQPEVAYVREMEAS